MCVIHSSYTLICWLKQPKFNLTLPRICVEFPLVRCLKSSISFTDFFSTLFSFHKSLLFFGRKSTWGEAGTRFTVPLGWIREKAPVLLLWLSGLLHLSHTITEREGWPGPLGRQALCKSSYIPSSFHFRRPEKSPWRCLSANNIFFFLGLMHMRKVLIISK